MTSEHDLAALEKVIGYTFQNKALLQTALTHSSHANESKQPEDYNERLEFLGDSVLSLVAARRLFAEVPALPEGELTRRRAAQVCEPALYGYARQIGLGQHLRLGRGEEKNGGRTRPSVLADAFEALLAAIYLDGGYEAASAFVLPFLSVGSTEAGDFKTMLQEQVQKDQAGRISYELVEETGPDHAKTFTVRVMLGAECAGEGEGNSKKAAEQKAAEAALERLGRG